MAIELKGTEIAEEMYDSLKKRVDFLHSKGASVVIRAVLVGDDPASVAYLGIKKRTCEALGIEFLVTAYQSDEQESRLISDIATWNDDQKITGVIVQLPLPKHLNRDSVLMAVSPIKDIDAFFYTLGTKIDLAPRPPAAAGMLMLLDRTFINIQNKNIVVVGHGLLVGQPLVKMLQERGLRPLVIDSVTKNRADILRRADVIMSGVGQPNIIIPDMVKEGVVIIDAGYSRVDGKTMGDVRADCAEKASFFTPPIGGVGPLTVSCLLDNAVSLVEERFRGKG